MTKSEDVNSNASNKPPLLAQASSAISHFLVPGNNVASAKGSFDSSSKTSSIDVNTLSSSVSPVSASGYCPPNLPREGAGAVDSGNASLAPSAHGGQGAEATVVNNEEVLKEKLQQEVEKLGGEEEEAENAVTSLEPQLDHQACARLCSLLKAQLVKAHEEMIQRYGGQTAVFTQDDLVEAPGEADHDLEGLMFSIFSSTRQQLNERFAQITSMFSGSNTVPITSNEDEANGQEGDVKKTEDSLSGEVSNIPKAVSSQDIAQALYGTKSASSHALMTTEACKEEEETAKASNQIELPQDGKKSLQEAAALPEWPEENDELGERKGEKNISTMETCIRNAFLTLLAVFSTVEVAPLSHRFNLSLFQPTDPKTFIKFVRKEINLLKTSLPKGIHVKAFEDRMVKFSLPTRYMYSTS